MKKKFLTRVLTAVGIASCCLCMLSAPVATMPVQAAIGGQTVAAPNKAIKEWVYKESLGKLWKRLWNCSTGQFEGKWIYVCDL